MIIFRILLFIMCLSPIASFAIESSSVSEKEMKSFLEAIKEKKDEELIIASDQFEKCKPDFEAFKKDPDKKADPAAETAQKIFKDCLTDEFLGGGDDPEAANTKLLEIAKKLGLNSFNKEAAESTKSIKEYLEKRINKAVYGEEDTKSKIAKLESQNFANHDMYYQLYAEQIGKNTLLEVARYCLENFGFGDGNNLVIQIPGPIDTATSKPTILLYPVNVITPPPPRPATGESPFSALLVVDPKIDDDPQNFVEDFTKSYPRKQFDWDSAEIKEFEVCTFDTDAKCKLKYKTTPFRSLHIISLLKDAEFKLASLDPEKKLIKQRYGFCSNTIIKNMCELYKCNNVYDKKSPKIEKDRCKKLFEIELREDRLGGKTFGASEKDKKIADLKFLESKTDKPTGAIACNLISRLEEYRTVLKGVKQIQEGLKEETKDRIAFADNAKSFGFKGVYDANKVGDITTVSSTELKEGVTSLKDSQDTADDLKEKCMEEDSTHPEKFVLTEAAKDDEECSLLMAKLNKVKLSTITLDTQVKTAIKLKEIEALEEKEDIEQFLKDNNMSQYLDRIADLTDQTKIDEIRNLIAQNFNVKRMALVDRLRKKFKKESDLHSNEDHNDTEKDKQKTIENDIANQTIADIETHKERVVTLFEYSNIVSSFLDVKEEDGGKSVGQNTAGRVKELAGGSKLQEYFSNLEGAEGSSQSGQLEYINAINSFVDFKKEGDSLTQP